MGTTLKTTLLIVGLVGIFLYGSLAKAADSVLYTFDELTIGSTLSENALVADTSGNGNDAVAHNGPTVVDGRNGGSALEFHGSQFLETSLDLNGDWTFETQIKTGAGQPHGAYLFARDSHVTAMLEFRVNQHNSGQLGLKWQAPNSAVGRLESWNLGPAVDDDEWHHVAVSVNAATSTMTVYVDGVEEHSTTNANFDGVTNVGTYQIANFSQPSAGGSLDGLMDFMRITDAVLEPADFFTGEGGPTRPDSTQFTWNTDGSGDWQDQNNWSYNEAPKPRLPNDKDHTAIFGDTITSTNTVFTNSPVRAGVITFANSNRYVIAGAGGVSIEAGTSGASLFVLQGEHEFQTPVGLVTDADVQVVGGSRLIFNNSLNLNGNTLTKTGGGDLAIRNDLVSGGGTIDVQGGTVSGNGTVGGNLFNGGAVSPGNGAGVASVVPEPSGMVLAVFGLVGLLARGRSKYRRKPS